jgi:hypothetical protein
VWQVVLLLIEIVRLIERREEERFFFCCGCSLKIHRVESEVTRGNCASLRVSADRASGDDIFDCVKTNIKLCETIS